MSHKLLPVGYIVGSISLFLGILVFLISGSIIKIYVLHRMKLVPGTDLYNQWLKAPLDIYMNFYLYDLVNGPEFLQGKKPIFKEIGPFVYQEFMVKENIVNNNNYTISYTERRHYEFQPQLSPYEIDYQLTSLNMAVVTVLSQIRYSAGAFHTAINIALSLTKENSLLIKKPAREILFGYEDNFLKQLKKLVPSLVPTTTVGLFTDRNNTIYANYTIYTGADDYTKVGAVERYYHMDKLNVWSTPYANMINGTDGSVLSPFLNSGKTIYSFQKDLCRSIYGKAQESVKLLENIQVLKFSPDEYFFANVSVNPDNAGFCTPADNCLPAGLLNLTNCLAGIPIIMTCPHFLYCDPKYAQQIDGPAPDIEKHGTYVYVEHLTGIVMKANKRIQFNTQLFRDHRVDCAKTIPEVLYPLFWVDEHFDLDKKNADNYIRQVRIPLFFVEFSKIFFTSFGSVLLLACATYTAYNWIENKRSLTNISRPINDSPDPINENTPLINHF